MTRLPHFLDRAHDRVRSRVAGFVYSRVSYLPVFERMRAGMSNRVMHVYYSVRERLLQEIYP